MTEKRFRCRRKIRRMKISRKIRRIIAKIERNISILGKRIEYMDELGIVREESYAAKKIRRTITKIEMSIPTLAKQDSYLDELGLPRDGYHGNFIRERKLLRFVERMKYGFDYSDVYNMNLAFAEWMYSHLKMFLAHNQHDLEYHKIEFEGETYTIGAAIDRILDTTEMFLKTEIFLLEGFHEEIVEKQLEKAGRLFVKIMGYCWL